jgi:large subunit ribosomal protein L10
MLTKQQKSKQIEESQKLLDENRLVFFADFSGTSVEDLKQLRKIMRELGAKVKVIKKKLLRAAFEKKGADFNPEQFESQAAAIFAPKDISEIAPPIYKFSKEKEKKGFKILGAYDLSEKNFLDAETVKRIGRLPSREVLLAQLVGMLSMPIKMFMYVLNEKGRKGLNSKS